MMLKVGVLVLCQFFYANENPNAVNGKATTPHEMVGTVVAINHKDFYTSKLGKDGNTYAFKDSEEYLEIAGNDAAEEIHYFIKSKACTPVITKEEFQEHEQTLDEKKPLKAKNEDKKEESGHSIPSETISKVVTEAQKKVESESTGSSELKKADVKKTTSKVLPKKKEIKKPASQLPASTSVTNPVDNSIIVKSKVEGMDDSETAPAEPKQLKSPSVGKEEKENSGGISGVVKDIVNGISK